MKIKELRQKKTEELKDLLKTLEKDLLNSKVDFTTAKSKSNAKIRGHKKDISRVKTLLAGQL